MSDLILKRKKITYDHPTRVFVPVFQKDYDDQGNLLFSPTFTYSMSDATEDEQLAWSFQPDYVLELSGQFNATTKDIIFKEED